MTERRSKKGRFGIKSEPANMTLTPLPNGRGLQMGVEGPSSSAADMLRRYIEEASALIAKPRSNQAEPTVLTATELAHRARSRAEHALHGIGDDECSKEELARRCLEAASYYELMLTVEFEGAIIQVEAASKSGRQRAASFAVANEKTVSEYERLKAATNWKDDAIFADIAERSGLTSGAVKKRIQRHRK